MGKTQPSDLTIGLTILGILAQFVDCRFGGRGFGFSGGHGGFGGYGSLGAPGLGGYGYGGPLDVGFGLWGGYPGFGFPWLAPPLNYQINTGTIYGTPGISYYNPGPGLRNSYINDPEQPSRPVPADPRTIVVIPVAGPGTIAGSLPSPAVPATKPPREIVPNEGRLGGPMAATLRA